MSDRLFGAPLEAVPLYAALAVLHDWSAGLPANTCLGSSAVTIEALRLLGFDAKMLTAYVEVHRTGQSDGAPLETVGRPDGDAVALPNGSSIDGHVVVWAESFGRMVDSSLMQLPRLRAAADDNEIQLLPLITPMDKAQLLASRMGLQRDPYLIVYRVF